MQTVIKAAGAADFLALLPVLAGYTPTRSLALVAFRGSRTLGVLRVDLPPHDADAQTVSRCAATFIGLVCRLRDADGVVPVVYCDEQLYPEAGGGTDSPLAHTALVAAVLQRADACGLRVSDALCVASDAWCSYLEASGSSHPLTELDASPARAAVPGGTARVSGDQATGIELPTADFAERERVGVAIERLTHALDAMLSGDDWPTTGSTRPGSAWLDAATITLERASRGVNLPGDGATLGTAGALGALCDVPALFEDALGTAPDDLGPDVSAALLLCLARPSMRDVALSQWSFDLDTGDEVLEAQLAWQDGVEFPSHLAAHMIGEGPQPDIARVQTALTLVRHLAAVAPKSLRPAPLTVAAWLSWALGRSTHAAAYLDLVRAIDANYGLAQIVSSMVSAGHLPEWAFER